MRVASMIISNFIPFQDSGIKELSITFTEDVQIFIGSNGSGKSSLLSQLSVYPYPRSIYEKGKGFSSKVIENNGTYYRLESEYEKPSSPHLFYENDNDENLNVGRTTQSQHDLIVQYLGVTPLIDDLIMNRYVFPKMGVSRRKEFLMSVNPDQIGFVLTKIKHIASQIKACKNNLARLQSRKILLEQDLLSDDMIESLMQEKHHISDSLAAFQQNLMDIEIGLRTTPKSDQLLSLEDISSIKNTITKHHYRLAKFPHIERDDRKRQSHRESLLAKIAVCDQRLQQTDEDILQQSTELSELEAQYRELSPEGDLNDIDNTIARLESERDKLQIPRPTFELSEQELQSNRLELETLRHRLQIFSNLTITLIPTKRRQHRDRMLASSQYKQSSYRMRLSDLENQYEDLHKRHTITPKDIPDSPCAKDRCPLYAHFMGEYQNTETRRQAVRRSIEKGRRKIERLDRYVNGLITYSQQSKPYIDQIQWLVTYAQSNPILHHILRQMDILSVLSTNPNRIIRQLEEAYDRIDQWIKLKNVLSELETAYAFKSRQISSENHDTIKLVSSIESLKKSLYGLRNVIAKVLDQKKKLTQDLEDVNAFSILKADVLEIQEMYFSMVHALSNNHERDKLNFLRQGIEELRARHFLRMGEVEKTLRSQSSLQDRYQEEVLSQITVIEKELNDLQQIETALIAIPKENMVGFINTLFDQANRLIEAVWTVPFKIELLSLDDPLTYEFQVSGDNQSSREMSDCSEGQTEMLSLAINLALRIILGHMNFPICLDESGRTFDTKHKQNLAILLRRLLDDNVISQLFIVSHHAELHEAFSSTETLVIREDNVLLPETFNLHCTMK